MKAVVTLITKSKAPFKYSPQLTVLLSSKKPVSIVAQVNKTTQLLIKFIGQTKKTISTNKVMKTEPAPVGFPFAASEFSLSAKSLPRSCGRRL